MDYGRFQIPFCILFQNCASVFVHCHFNHHISNNITAIYVFKNHNFYSISCNSCSGDCSNSLWRTIYDPLIFLFYKVKKKFSISWYVNGIIFNNLKTNLSICIHLYKHHTSIFLCTYDFLFKLLPKLLDDITLFLCWWLSWA